MANQYAGRFFDALIDSNSQLQKLFNFVVTTDSEGFLVATTYTDRTKTTVAPSILSTNADGMAEFYATPGTYYVKTPTRIVKVDVYEDVADTVDVEALNVVVATVAAEAVTRAAEDIDNLADAKQYADDQDAVTLAAAATETAGLVSALDAQVVKKTGANVVTGSINVTGGLQVNSQDVASVSYVDTAAQGLKPLDAVRLATTVPLPTSTRSGNVITASGNGALPAIDGVAPVLNNPILVKNEVDGTRNGPYVVTVLGTSGTPFELTRRNDFDLESGAVFGSLITVDEGVTLAGTSWFLETENPIDINETALSFKKFAGAQQLLAGAHVEFDGRTVNVLTGAGELATETFVTDITDTKALAFTDRYINDTDGTAAAWESIEYNCTYGIRTLLVPNYLPEGTELRITLSTVGTGKQLNISWNGLKYGSSTGSTGVTSLTTTGEQLHVRRMSGYWLPLVRSQTPAALATTMDAKDDVVLSTASSNTSASITAALASLDLSAVGGGGKIRIKGYTGSDEYFLRISSAGALVADPLMYERPDFSDYRVVEITDKTHVKIDGGSTQSWFGNNIEAGDFGLAVDDDVVFYLPTASTMGRVGGVALGLNMRNVAVIGGEFLVDDTIFTPPYGPDAYTASERMNLTMNNFKGQCYMEGVYAHGNRLGDAFRFNPNGNVPHDVIVQNCHVGNLGAPGGGPAATSIAGTTGGTDSYGTWDSSTFQHADCYQFLSDTVWTTYGGLKMYQCIEKTGYQGLLFNQALGRGIELDRWRHEAQTTTNWDGSQFLGYAVGFFAGQSASDNMSKTIGEDVISYMNTSTGRTKDWYYESSQPAGFTTTKATYVDPNWIRDDYGRTYRANMPNPQVLLTTDQVVALIAAHATDKTDVHGFADTDRVPRVVNAGSVLNTARPSTSAPVIWTATGTPTAAVDGDIIVEYTA